MRVFSSKLVTDALDALTGSRTANRDVPTDTPPTGNWIDRAVIGGLSSEALAVRMAVKNTLIVAALRDQLVFDARALALAAEQKYAALALESDATASRLDRDPTVTIDCTCDACQATDEEKKAMRSEVHRRIAVALRDEVRDRDRIASIIREARRDAWNEVGRTIRPRLQSLGYAPILDRGGHLDGTLNAGNALLAALLGAASRARHRHEVRELRTMIERRPGQGED